MLLYIGILNMQLKDNVSHIYDRTCSALIFTSMAMAKLNKLKFNYGTMDVILCILRPLIFRLLATRASTAQVNAHRITYQHC